MDSEHLGDSFTPSFSPRSWISTLLASILMILEPIHEHGILMEPVHEPGMLMDRVDKHGKLMDWVHEHGKLMDPAP